MNKQIMNSAVNQNPIRFFLVAVFSFLALFFSDVQAASPMQDSIRDRVYGPKKQKVKSSLPITQTNKRTTKRIIDQGIKKTDNFPKKINSFVPNRSAASKKSDGVKRTPIDRPKQRLLNVTFTAMQPGAEVWINSRNVGLTDKSGKFSKKLAPNSYRIAVRKGTQTVFPVKEIVVAVGRTDFNLFVEKAAQNTSEQRNLPPVVVETKKSLEELNKEISDRVKQILEDYVDPVKTDMISLDDWEFVYKSSQFGYLQGLTAAPTDAQRWLASGQIELAKGDYTNAFTSFAKSKEFMPKSALPFYGLGNTHIANNQPEEALKAFQQAARLEPKLGMVYKGIGDAQRLLKNKKEAVVAYKNARQLGYITPEVRRLLATMQMETEDTKEGLKELEELAEIAPSAELYVAIGDGYQKRKQNVTAIEFYRKAIEYKSDLAVAHFKLGNVHFDVREYSKSNENLEKAIELDPDGKTFDILSARKKARLAKSKIK